MSDWYQEYLQSDHWQKTRIERLLLCDLRDHPQAVRCEHHDCGLWVPLNVINVHHLTYDTLGHERMDDLSVYCRSCHAFTHGFPRAVWWDAAKKQNLTVVTQDHYRNYRSILKIGEVLFECLEKAPHVQLRAAVEGLRRNLAEDNAKAVAKEQA